MPDRHTLIARDRIELTYYTVVANEAGKSNHSPSTLSLPTSKPVILLIHGLGSNHTRWLEFVEQSDFCRHRKVILPDLRGHGQSMADASVSMDLWARDLAEILQKENQPRAILMGHSMGAHVALFFLYLYPDKVSGLVLIDPLLRSQFTPTMRRLWRWRIPIYAFIAVVRVANRLGIRRHRIAARDLRDFDKKARQLLAENRQEEMVKYYSSIWVDLRYNPVATYFKSTFEVLRPLPPIQRNTIPLLLLVSGRSAYRKENSGDAYFDAFQQCTVNSVQCDHWPITEKPQEVYQAIENWLRKKFNQY